MLATRVVSILDLSLETDSNVVKLRLCADSLNVSNAHTICTLCSISSSAICILKDVRTLVSLIRTYVGTGYCDIQALKWIGTTHRRNVKY